MVEEEFGPVFQAAGCEVIFGDNDKKLHVVVTTKLFLFPIDFEMSASKMLGQNSELMFGLEQEWWLIVNPLLRKQILRKKISGGSPSIAPIAWCWISQLTTLGKI